MQINRRFKYAYYCSTSDYSAELNEFTEEIKEIGFIEEIKFELVLSDS